MADLKTLALKLATDGPFKTLATPRKVKILFNGHYILQTTNAQYVWEHPFFPQFYVPRVDLEVSSSHHPAFQIIEGESYNTEDGQNVASQLVLKVGDRSVEQVVAFRDGLTGRAESLGGLVKIDFASVDQWFEEDTPIFKHPKDPFKRIDILQSTRHIRIHIDGVLIAETHFAQHLYETLLPCRYYMPLTAVEMDLLRPSKTRTMCPYKGEAEYYSIEVQGKLHEDVVWFYNRPTLECGPITGMVCFYNEGVDIELDGEKMKRPETHFGKSRGKPPAFSHT